MDGGRQAQARIQKLALWKRRTLARFADHQEGLPPQTISLNVVFSPFDEGGGEVTLTLNRYIIYKTKPQPQGLPQAMLGAVSGASRKRSRRQSRFR
jgi:hypothetical protein